MKQSNSGRAILMRLYMDPSYIVLRTNRSGKWFESRLRANTSQHSEPYASVSACKKLLVSSNAYKEF